MDRTDGILISLFFLALVVWIVVSIASSNRPVNVLAPNTNALTTQGPGPGTTATTSTATGPEPAATETTAAEIDPVARGMSLAARNGCAACHSADGSALQGPSWFALFGTTEQLTDGTEVVVDEDYVIESILDPNAKIADGYPPDLMPKDFAEKLSEDDLGAIVAYMKSLSAAGRQSP